MITLEEIFLENGLVAYWIARLALLCRNRIEARLIETIWHPDCRGKHWLGLLLPYFERKKKTFLLRDEAADHYLINVKAFFEGLYELLPDLEAGASSFDPILKENLEIFSEALGLDEKERTFLTFIILNSDPFWEQFLRDLGEMSFNSALNCLARLFGWPLMDLYQVLTSGRLVSGNLLHANFWRNGKVSLNNLFEIDELLLERLFIRHRDRWEFFSGYFRLVSSPALPLERFSHLPELGILTGYLEHALREKRRGVNVLLYGPPGTGKTELSKALATHLRANLFEVAFLRPDLEPLTPANRLKALFIAQQVLSSSSERSIILLDEAEDIISKEKLSFSKKETPSKIQVNRLLESNPIPVIWIVNALRGIDPAHLRRFDLVVPVESMPVEIRLQLIREATERLPVSEAWRQTLAREEIPPALITRAARVVATVNSGEPERDLERLLSSALQIMGKGPVSAPRSRPKLPFRAEVLNTSPPIEEIFALTESDYPARLFFYGPPGTGKTELARRLAERLGRPLLVRRASDLFSPYVGETERAIADMFREAERKGAVLLLDEVDSFLRTRREARNSWEITWVNEMLTGMERYEGWFICTTNLAEILDEATARRFDLRVEFRPMEPEQAWRLFVALFGDAAREEHRRRLFTLRLTPGNFATVYRRLSLLGAEKDPDRFLQELERETEGLRSRPSIGFTVDLSTGHLL